jgi:type I restriction enzyme S subunit
LKFGKEIHFKDHKIGRFPSDWQDAKLEDVLSQLRNGIVASQNKEGRGIPITRIETISDEKIDTNKLGYLEKVNALSYADFLLTEGDILFSHINSLAHIGKTALYEGVPKSLLHGMNLLLLRPKTNVVNPKYLLYLLKLFKKRNLFRAIAKKAVNQASINQTELGGVRVPIPSMFEQQGIIEVLSCVDSAIQRTDEVVAKTERLKKGLMQKLLTEGIDHKEYKDTEIGKTPKTWEKTTIDKECLVGTGGTPSRTTEEYFGGNIPWVKSTEVDYNVITSTEETITKKGVENSNAKVYPADSLVIALYGQGTTRGKCALLGIDAAVNQACAVIQSKGRIHIPYLFYWCQHSYSQIRSLSQGANQSNLNMGIVRSLELPLPPPSEQKKIVEILSTTDKKLELEKSERLRLERIKRGLMDLLLTGKIRVKVD